jgi:hypothetical protein
MQAVELEVQDNQSIKDRFPLMLCKCINKKRDFINIQENA